MSVELQYMPPGGTLGALFAKLFGEEPQHQIREDLRHLKQIMETGEVPSISGQSRGPRLPDLRASARRQSDLNEAEPNEVGEGDGQEGVRSDVATA